jgi:hypothetical protein
MSVRRIRYIVRSTCNTLYTVRYMTLYDFLSIYIRDFERNTLFSTISDQYGRAGRFSFHWKTNMKDFKFFCLLLFLKLYLHHVSKIKIQKKSSHKTVGIDPGFSYYFCLIIEGIRIRKRSSYYRIRIRIQEAQKHKDPADPDPHH